MMEERDFWECDSRRQHPCLYVHDGYLYDRKREKNAQALSKGNLLIPSLPG